jgi:hypothetical protein
MTPDRTQVVKAGGGHPAPGSPEFRLHGPVSPGTFKKGARYWVAFSSYHDQVRYPQGIIKVWPDGEAPKLLDEAIRGDHYAPRPQYDPESGLTFSHRAAAAGQGGWKVRMERDGKLLWEAELPGTKFGSGPLEGDWNILHRDNWSSGLRHAGENRSGRFLLAETSSRLEPANGYRLPAGKYRLTFALDADSGKTAAVWVSQPDRGPTSTPLVIHYLDLKTGSVRREERYDLLETGGLAAGAKEERWFRKLVRIYAPGTSEPTAEQVFRWTGLPQGNGYAPVNRR